MKDDKSVLKNKILWIIVACLLIAILATAAAFSDRISNFMSKPDKTIDVTAGKAKVVKSKTKKEKNNTASSSSSAVPLPDESGRTIWRNKEHVDIFKFYYDDKDNPYVESNNGDKVIAPGTGNTYTVQLANRNRFWIDYKVYVKSRFSIEDEERADYPVPFLLGIAEQDRDIALNNVSLYYTKNYDNENVYGVQVARGRLQPGRNINYDLKWEWPFERGEWVDSDTVYEYEYDNDLNTEEPKLDSDMSLAKLADEDKRPTLDVTITVIAEYEGTQPPTGDYVDIGIIAALTVVIILTVILMLILRKKNKEEE